MVVHSGFISIQTVKALRVLNRFEISTDLYRALFVIDADPRDVKSKPFADISSFSDFVEEREILFMIGCVVRLIDIRRDNNQQIWIIKMKLCGDDQHQLKKLFDHMKKEYGGGDTEVNLRSFGDVLRRMGKYDELSSYDPSLYQLYNSLGLVTKDKSAYNSNLQWYDKSLKIKMRTDPSDNVNISRTYTCIGVVHRLKGDTTSVREYYNNAILLFQQVHGDNHPDMGDLSNSIALIYKNEDEYLELLKYFRKSLSIGKRHFPSDHPDIVQSHNNIGNVHRQHRQYDLGMQNCEQSL